MSESKNAAERPKLRNGVRAAWRWLIAYGVAEVFFYVSFEWRHAVYGDVEEWTFFRTLDLFFFAGASFVLFIRSLLKRRKAAALLYAALFGINLYWPSISIELDNTAKAYFFSTFPEKCPEGKPEPGYRVALCYQIFDPDFGRTALFLNPGNELAAPYTSWPPEFDKVLFNNSKFVHECQKKHIRRLVDHVYLLEDLPEC